MLHAASSRLFDLDDFDNLMHFKRRVNNTILEAIRIDPLRIRSGRSRLPSTGRPFHSSN